MASEAKQLRVLFSGLGTARVVHYRVLLPAMFLGCDWAGFVGVPPKLQFASGFVGGLTQPPDFFDYDIVILQQPRGHGWLKLIREMKSRGATVLYEIDDYVHEIRKLPQHDFAGWFQKDHLKQMELCMKACDGMIVSTDYLAERYNHLARGRVWVCENGLDMGRYAYTRPERSLLDGRETVTILWAGATGHGSGVKPWVDEIANLMRKHSNLCFVSIGQGFSQWLSEFGTRAVSLPFAALETYPAAMMAGDIVIAPMGESKWHAAKSDLRVMEAAALGIPVVASKHYAGSVIEGETGFVVSSVSQLAGRLERLITDRKLRDRMSVQSREYSANFDMTKRHLAWREALTEAWLAKNPVEALAA